MQGRDVMVMKTGAFGLFVLRFSLLKDRMYREKLVFRDTYDVHVFLTAELVKVGELMDQNNRC